MAEDTRYVRGGQKLAQRLATIRAAIGLPALTQEIGNLLLRRTLERFDREVDPDGVKWVELSEDTIVAKRRLGYGGTGKLKRDLRLRQSIHLIRGGSGSIFTNTGAGVRIGIDDPEVVNYAAALNRGSKTIPARRFLGIGRNDVTSVDSLMRRKAAQLEAL